MTRLCAVLTLLAAAVFAPAVLSAAADREVTIGYQKVYNPWKIVVADRTLERLTAYRINWRAFDSGAQVIEAMAEGDVEIALAGSSPIAAAVSNGVGIELFWITEDIASSEALVVRNGSGIGAPRDLRGKCHTPLQPHPCARIGAPRDLRGKCLAVPFISTSHFHTLFALEQFEIDPEKVDLLNMQPPAIASAWERGDIDAAFVWNPVLGRISKNGRVLLTSGELSRWGKATFDGMVALKKWSAAHPDFMVAFVSAVAEADESYRSDPEAWTAESDPVKKIARVVGGNPEDVPGALALYDFPTLEEQASGRWLGGGKRGGAAQALFHTSRFLKAERKIGAVLDDYATAINPEWVKRALDARGR